MTARKIVFQWVLVLLMTTGMTMAAYSQDPVNLVTNPSFEQVEQGLPVGWVTEEWKERQVGAQFTVVEKGARTGKKMVSITNPSENHSYFMQKVVVKPNKMYKLSGWVKALNVGQDKKGASIGIGNHLETSADIKGTSADWQYAEMYVNAGAEATDFNLFVKLGSYGSTNTGTAFFDDISVTEVDSIPAGAVTAGIGVVAAKAPQAAGATTNTQGSDNPIWWIVILLAVVLGIVFYIMYSKKPNKDQPGE